MSNSDAPRARGRPPGSRGPADDRPPPGLQTLDSSSGFRNFTSASPLPSMTPNFGSAPNTSILPPSQSFQSSHQGSQTSGAHSFSARTHSDTASQYPPSSDVSAVSGSASTSGQLSFQIESGQMGSSGQAGSSRVSASRASATGRNKSRARGSDQAGPQGPKKPRIAADDKDKAEADPRFAHLFPLSSRMKTKVLSRALRALRDIFFDAGERFAIECLGLGEIFIYDEHAASRQFVNQQTRGRNSYFTVAIGRNYTSALPEYSDEIFAIISSFLFFHVKRMTEIMRRLIRSRFKLYRRTGPVAQLMQAAHLTAQEATQFVIRNLTLSPQTFAEFSQLFLLPKFGLHLTDMPPAMQFTDADPFNQGSTGWDHPAVLDLLGEFLAGPNSPYFYQTVEDGKRVIVNKLDRFNEPYFENLTIIGFFLFYFGFTEHATGVFIEGDLAQPEWATVLDAFKAAHNATTSTSDNKAALKALRLSWWEEINVDYVYGTGATGTPAKPVVVSFSKDHLNPRSTTPLKFETLLASALSHWSPDNFTALPSPSLVTHASPPAPTGSQWQTSSASSSHIPQAPYNPLNAYTSSYHGEIGDQSLYIPSDNYIDQESIVLHSVTNPLDPDSQNSDNDRDTSIHRGGW